MPWIKDPEGNFHNVNWLTAKARKNALGWEIVNESEVQQAQKRKTSTYSSSPASSTAESETMQIAQNAVYSSIMFDDSPKKSHSSRDDSSNHHSHHTDSSASHSHHASHDYSSHSSHDSGSSYDCSSGSDFGGGDF
jgi:hypothetical protein